MKYNIILLFNRIILYKEWCVSPTELITFLMQSTGTLWFPCFFGRGWGWGHQLYKVQFVPPKICTVWLHKSSLMDRSRHGSLKNKASRSSNMCGLFSDHLGSHPNSGQPEPKEQQWFLIKCSFFFLSKGLSPKLIKYRDGNYWELNIAQVKVRFQVVRFP